MENLNLFSSLTIRNLTIKNRIALSPMQMYSATNGIPGNWHLVHLGSRAVGGAGLIITECTAVSPDGMNTLSDVGLWNQEQTSAWKPIVKFVQEQGAAIAVQLWHSGGKGSHTHPNEGFKPLSVKNGGWVTKSSSPTPMGGVVPEMLTIQEIERIKNDFVMAAKNAVEAGFDAIELHAGHGYLFHQFYSAYINHRTDEYGGSFSNRVRFLLDTVHEVRKVIPAMMPLLVRISAVDYLDNSEAWTLDDSIRLSKLLKENGVDFITASGGGFAHVDKSLVHPNYQLPFATAIKEHTGITTGTVGMINDAEQANQIIYSGQADMVVIAREFLRNPNFGINAAKELAIEKDIPWQYKRAY